MPRGETNPDLPNPTGPTSRRPVLWAPQGLNTESLIYMCVYVYIYIDVYGIVGVCGPCSCVDVSHGTPRADCLWGPPADSSIMGEVVDRKIYMGPTVSKISSPFDHPNPLIHGP